MPLLFSFFFFFAFAEDYDCDQYTHTKEHKENPWGKTDLTPAAGAAEAIGFYSRGCFQGGVALELSGPGHEVVCPQRQRNWGHPKSIAAVKEWGNWSKNNGYGKLMIRDISQPRGGPVVGHGSHQLGRDIDITFETWKKNRPMTDKERRTFPVTKMALNYSDPAAKKGVSQFHADKWDDTYGKIIEKIASSSKTARIFISPPIKKAICRQFALSKNGKPLDLDQKNKLQKYVNSKEKQKDEFTFPSWLRRLQPMGGHEGHFHVRLKCPSDSPSCKNQRSMNHSSYSDKTDSSGVGCSGLKLNWWTETDPDKAGKLKDKIRMLARAKKKKKPVKKDPHANLPWWEKKQKKSGFPQRCRDLITPAPPAEQDSKDTSTSH